MENGKQPAFARPKSGETAYAQQGLTKREYFAALAMQGLLANQLMGMRSVSEISEVATLQADDLLEYLYKTK